MSLIIKPRPIDLLLVNRSRGDGGVPPETMLEIYGENWDGTIMSGHIGGTIVESGTVNSDISAPLNNKKTMRTNGSSAYFTASQVASGGFYNYIIIGVYFMLYVPTNQEGMLLDFYDETALTGNLRAFTWLSNDAVSDEEKYWAGYGYGISSNIRVAEDLQGVEDQTSPQIRVWIFEDGQGKYYRGGGSPIITDSWIPCEVGAGNQRRKIGTVSGGNLTANIGHVSLHKFPATLRVSKVWVNTYAQALASFYNLSWTDIV